MASRRRSRPAVSTVVTGVIAPSSRSRISDSASLGPPCRRAGGHGRQVSMTAARTMAGPSTSAWSSRSRTQSTQRLGVGHRQTAPPRRRRPGASMTASSPSSATTRPDSAASIRTSTSTSSPPPNCHGSRPKARSTSKSEGSWADAGSSDLGRTVDPVDPEGPGLAPVAVESDQVPVAVAEPEPGHVHLALFAPVVEADTGPLADGVEHQRERRQPVDGAQVDQRRRRPDGAANRRPSPSFSRAS